MCGGTYFNLMLAGDPVSTSVYS